MHREQLAPVTSLALAATLALGAALVAPDAHAASDHSRKPGYTFAVIGDVPYGEPAQAHFPAFIDGINADPDVAWSRTSATSRAARPPATTSGSRPSGPTSTASRTRSSTRRATTSGPTATGPTTAATSRSSGSTRSGRCSSPAPVRRWAHRPGSRRRPPAASRRTSASPAAGCPSRPCTWSAQQRPRALVRTNTGPTPAQVAEEQHRMDVTIDNVRAAFRDGPRAPSARGGPDAAGGHVRPTVADPKIADYSAFRAAGAGAHRRVAAVPRPGLPLQRRQPPLHTRTARSPPARRGCRSTGSRARPTTCAGSPSTARTSARPTGSR